MILNKAKYGLFITAICLSACGGLAKKKKSSPEVNPKKIGDSSKNESGNPGSPVNPGQTTPVPEVKLEDLSLCSQSYVVSAQSNPYLAGFAEGLSIDYGRSIDTTLAQSPLAVIPSDPTCMNPGRSIYLEVSGTITHGTLPQQKSEADGQADRIVQHQLGRIFGLTNLKAPVNSLVGVFVGPEFAQNRSPSPAKDLDFSLAASRTFVSLNPELGQIFFIGDGKDEKGQLQAFQVPVGAQNLYLAVWDEYEWNNNSGELTARLRWVKP